MLVKYLLSAAFALGGMIPPPDSVFKGRPLIVLPTVPIGRDKFVAPYIYLSQYDGYNVAANRAVAGTKFWSLAFIIADGNNNPSWGGDSINAPFYSNYIGAIRAAGGDVIVSFGGASGFLRDNVLGNELALVTYSASALAAKYQSVIDLYSLTFIDIDVEGSAAGDQASLDRRSQAIAILLSKNPGLKVSLTIAATTTGLDWSGLNIIRSALNAGVQLYQVNLMTMDYGGAISNMGQVAINGAAGTHAQLQSMGMYSKIGMYSRLTQGVTAMIGVNDVSSEVFGLYDAQVLTAWASQTSYIGMLSFWSAARDVNNQWGPLYASSQIAQSNFQFSSIMMGFSSSSSGVADYYSCSSSTTCKSSGFTCCTALADLASGKTSCRPTSNCATTTPDYKSCSIGTSVCASSGSTCCTAQADLISGATTCRPAGNCASKVVDYSACTIGTSVCASSGSTCCTAQADLVSGSTTCRPSANCASKVVDYNACTIGTSVCATSSFVCCTAPADVASGLTSCRPTTNCGTKTTTTAFSPTTKSGPKTTPMYADPNYQGGYTWGNRIFAPIVDITANQDYDMVALSNTVGTARYVLGYVCANAKNAPAWGGNTATSSLAYLTSIQAIRLFGGDVIISFGGPGGIELASVAASAKALQINYQNVIDAYSVSWIEISLDSSSASNYVAADLRNQALRAMQVSNPNLRISYSLPITPQGLTVDGLYVLNSAANVGVRVDVVNIQAYNYGAVAAPNAGSASGTYAIQAATFTNSQLLTVGLTSKIGVTLMIGQSDVQTEYFKQADATQVVNWAKATKWVGLLSIENANRDNVGLSGITQTKDQFASLFVQYEN